MDENKLNNDLENEQTEDEALKLESEETAEETAEETVTEAEETAEDEIQNTDDSDAAADDVAEAEEQEIFESSVELPKKKKKKGKKALVALLVVVILLGLLAIAFVSVSVASKNIDVNKIAVSVGDVDSNVGEFINTYGMYSYYASYYGMTEEQVREYSITELVTVNSYYAKAIAAGYTLSEEDKQDVEASLSSIKEGAESSSMTEDEYLSENICKGFTVDMYRAYVEKQIIAQKFYNDSLAELEEKYMNSPEEIQKKYEEDRTLYDISDAAYLFIDATEDNAKESANSVVANVKSGKSFEEAIAAVDSSATPSDLSGLSKSDIETNFSSEAAEWIFELDGKNYKNGAGAITTIETESMIYVIYVNNEPTKNEEIPVSVNYIQVSVGTDTTIKSEDELDITAKATATNILASFNETAGDDDAFTALMTENENSDDSLVTTGSFEQIVKGDENDEAVEDWAFDEARKNGDCEIIKGEDCYYILYFVEADEYSVWYQTALNTLLETAYTEWDEGIKAEYEDKTVTNDDVIDEAIAYMTAVSA